MKITTFFKEIVFVVDCGAGCASDFEEVKCGKSAGSLPIGYPVETYGNRSISRRFRLYSSLLTFRKKKTKSRFTYIFF